MIQDIDMRAGEVVSRVGLSILSTFNGVVTTRCRAQPSPPDVVNLTVVETLVEDTNYTKFLEGIPVPVQNIFDRLRGEGSTNVAFRVVYVDSELRITRSLPDNEIFIYCKLRGDQLF